MCSDVRGVFIVKEWQCSDVKFLSSSLWNWTGKVFLTESTWRGVLLRHRDPEKRDFFAIGLHMGQDRHRIDTGIWHVAFGFMCSHPMRKNCVQDPLHHWEHNEEGAWMAVATPIQSKTSNFTSVLWVLAFSLFSKLQDLGFDVLRFRPGWYFEYNCVTNF